MIRGLKRGLPFTSNKLITASLLSAFPAKPYTVSVGMATSAPVRNSMAAFEISCPISVIMPQRTENIF
jgi:hypothetical protein